MALISSRELTEKLNVSYQTINFYTNLGLFEIQKRVGNKRFYDEDQTRARIQRILALKEEGYPLRVIVRQFSKDQALQVDTNGGQP
jgi:DNA-binding transcriptional MerR regulator